MGLCLQVMMGLSCCCLAQTNTRQQNQHEQNTDHFLFLLMGLMGRSLLNCVEICGVVMICLEAYEGVLRSQRLLFCST